jgi:hypothetical protein
MKTRGETLFSPAQWKTPRKKKTDLPGLFLVGIPRLGRMVVEGGIFLIKYF